MRHLQHGQATPDPQAGTTTNHVVEMTPWRVVPFVTTAAASLPRRLGCRAAKGRTVTPAHPRTHPPTPVRATRLPPDIGRRNGPTFT